MTLQREAMLAGFRFDTEYAAGLLFAADVTEAATRPEHGAHGAERLKDPYAQELLRCQRNYEWCDNRHDVDLAVHGALRATVDYVARRYALSPSPEPGRPHQLWPDLDDRLAALARALEFAAAAAEDAWRRNVRSAGFRCSRAAAFAPVRQ
ncbi:hypothetical protein [Luedemannella flava]|uniref:hypothetical protein n=1 Tax=Luedemannella flava TaxID=349316 RepID=UPI0031E2943B